MVFLRRLFSLPKQINYANFNRNRYHCRQQRTFNRNLAQLLHRAISRSQNQSETPLPQLPGAPAPRLPKPIQQRQLQQPRIGCGVFFLATGHPRITTKKTSVPPTVLNFFVCLRHTKIHRDVRDNRSFNIDVPYY